MKKLLFSAFDMNIGGIETSLLNLLNTLVDKNYDITLVLESKEGIFLSELDSKIKVIEYKPSTIKIVFIRKMINFIKRVGFIFKYKNKFDFSASYATYSEMASFTARTASKNSALWIHSDYTFVYDNDIEKIKTFFNTRKVNLFKHLIFVSNASSESFLKIYPNLKNKIILLGNLINYKTMLQLSNKEIYEQKYNKYIFLNVGRHSEQEKRLSRIIESCEKLKEKELPFQVWLIGGGKDTGTYQKMIQEKGLENHIKLLGIKKNPYPYFKLADAILLTSDYEGYPVVFQESYVFKKPIITTDVSDAMKDVQDKFGKVVSKDVDEISLAMEDFIKNGYEIKENFDLEAYNKEVLEKLENIL